MKKILLVFSDTKLTAFMQAADVFDRGKVLLCPSVAIITAPDEWDDKQSETAKLAAEKSGEYQLVAVISENNRWTNPDIRVVSTGQHWMPLADYVEQLKV